jgi:putative transposase
MKKSRFTEEQIVGILKQGEAGVKTAELCRQHGISAASYYQWKAKYGGLEVSEAQRLKQLEEENRKLKRIVADQSLDLMMLRDLVTKKMVGSAAQRAAVDHLMKAHQASERRACRLVGIARSTRRYQARKRAGEAELRAELVKLASQHPRYGYRRLTAKRREQGLRVNPKRVWRLCRQQRLQVPKKRRKRLMRPFTDHQPVTRPDQRWAMDFVADSLADGRTFRALAVVDTFTRECLAIEVDTSLRGERVRRVLEGLIALRIRPEEIRVDNGPEFVSRALAAWCEQNRVRLSYIQPGKPTQNGHAESFNGRFRDECLNANWFASRCLAAS